MQKILKGKTALITGSSCGLGLAIALTSVQAGADVVLAALAPGVTLKDVLESTEAELMLADTVRHAN